MVRKYRRVDCSLYGLLAIVVGYQFESGVVLVVAVDDSLDLTLVAELKRHSVAVAAGHSRHSSASITRHMTLQSGVGGTLLSKSFIDQRQWNILWQIVIVGRIRV